MGSSTNGGNYIWEMFPKFIITDGWQTTTESLCVSSKVIVFVSWPNLLHIWIVICYKIIQISVRMRQSLRRRLPTFSGTSQLCFYNVGKLHPGPPLDPLHFGVSRVPKGELRPLLLKHFLFWKLVLALQQLGLSKQVVFVCNNFNQYL